MHYKLTALLCIMCIPISAHLQPQATTYTRGISALIGGIVYRAQAMHVMEGAEISMKNTILQQPHAFTLSGDAYTELNQLGDDILATEQPTGIDNITPLAHTRESLETMAQPDIQHRTVFFVMDQYALLSYTQRGIPVFTDGPFIVITPAFMRLPYHQKKAIARHELGHIMHQDRSKRMHLTGTLMGMLFGYDFPRQISDVYAAYNQTITYTECAKRLLIPSKENLLMVGIGLWAYTCLSTVHEIQADLVCADQYEELNKALQSLCNTQDSTASYHPRNIASYISTPHMSNTDRYHYMQHYHEYGTLPYSITMRPSYILGKILQNMENAMTYISCPYQDIYH